MNRFFSFTRVLFSFQKYTYVRRSLNIHIIYYLIRPSFNNKHKEYKQKRYNNENIYPTKSVPYFHFLIIHYSLENRALIVCTIS